MRVGGSAEGDKDGGTSGGRHFRHRDRARAADDQVRLGKALRHILDKGKDLRVKFAPRIRFANSIIVAFAGLMHHEKLIFSAASRSSASITARLIGSAPRLPPVMSSVKGARCSLGGMAKNSLRTGQPVTTALRAEARGRLRDELRPRAWPSARERDS